MNKFGNENKFWNVVKCAYRGEVLVGDCRSAEVLPAVRVHEQNFRLDRKVLVLEPPGEGAQWKLRLHEVGADGQVVDLHGLHEPAGEVVLVAVDDCLRSFHLHLDPRVLVGEWVALDEHLDHEVDGEAVDGLLRHQLEPHQEREDRPEERDPLAVEELGVGVVVGNAVVDHPLHLQGGVLAEELIVIQQSRELLNKTTV